MVSASALQRLTPRLVALMTVALLPLGLISIWQTNSVVRDAENAIQSGLVLETVSYAANEREVLERGLGAINGLSSAPLTLSDARCAAVMREFVERNREFVFVGFLPLSKPAVCVSSTEIAGKMSVIDAGPEPSIAVSLEENGGAFMTINVSRPVFDGETLAGHMVVSVPNQIVRARLRNAVSGVDDIDLASLTPDGTIIASSAGIDAARAFLPGELTMTQIAEREGQSFKAMAANGEERLYAVAELVDETLYLVGSSVVVSAWQRALSPAWLSAITFPVLMWIAGVGVAIVGLQRLVLRHVRSLRTAMRRFALGERDGTKLHLEDASIEFEEAERAFNRMAFLVTEAEVRAQDDLRDKEVLLKEVHHRVKNNLQLIASIMNMQSRKATSLEAKNMLTGLQRRVRGLAMLHRTLYTTPDMTTINARDLIETVIAEASSIATQPGAIRSELEDFTLYPDQAVPLSMLVAEALTNAVKYADPDQLASEPVRVLLELHSAQVVRLRITNPVTGTSDDTAGDGLGAQLMTAFVRQLDGTCKQGRVGGLFTVDLTFERRDFEAADYG
ncbi:sensor histidine kinase [Primorskyibacter sp. S187A]|uniref:sensor histidine kinase n=1 Tax=Primorskyibacter sp. S187A TaxID=3415130 RepID=UPI003C7E7D10